MSTRKGAMIPYFIYGAALTFNPLLTINGQ